MDDNVTCQIMAYPQIEDNITVTRAIKYGMQNTILSKTHQHTHNVRQIIRSMIIGIILGISPSYAYQHQPSILGISEYA